MSIGTLAAPGIERLAELIGSRLFGGVAPSLHGARLGPHEPLRDPHLDRAVDDGCLLQLHRLVDGMQQLDVLAA